MSFHLFMKLLKWATENLSIVATRSYDKVGRVHFIVISNLSWITRAHLFSLSNQLVWLRCDSLCHRLCLDKITRVKSLETIRAMVETWYIIWLTVIYPMMKILMVKLLAPAEGAETKVEKSGPVPQPKGTCEAQDDRCTSGEWWWWWWSDDELLLNYCWILLVCFAVTIYH